MDVEAPSAPPVTDANTNAGEVDIVTASPQVSHVDIGNLPLAHTVARLHIDTF